MPSPTTAQKIIERAMRLGNIIAVGETPSPDEYNDALDVLNDIQEGWSIEGLTLWGTENTVFSTVVSKIRYTIGPTGDIVDDRPIGIADAYCTVAGVDFPVLPVDQLTYNKIRLKNAPANVIERLLYVNEYPDGVIYLWPVPLQVVNITMSISRVLGPVTGLTTTIAFPKGYAAAFTYALACRLCPEFHRPVPEDIGTLAFKLKANIKAANSTTPISRVDNVLLPHMGDVGAWGAGY